MLHNPPTCCCKQVISSFHRAQKQPTETTVMFSIKVILFELIEGIMGVMGRWLRYVDEQKRGEKERRTEMAKKMSGVAREVGKAQKTT